MIPKIVQTNQIHVLIQNYRISMTSFLTKILNLNFNFAIFIVWFSMKMESLREINNLETYVGCNWRFVRAKLYPKQLEMLQRCSFCYNLDFNELLFQFETHRESFKSGHFERRAASFSRQNLENQTVNSPFWTLLKVIFQFERNSRIQVKFDESLNFKLWNFIENKLRMNVYDQYDISNFLPENEIMIDFDFEDEVRTYSIHTSAVNSTISRIFTTNPS